MKQNFSSHIWNKYSGINPLAIGLDISILAQTLRKMRYMNQKRRTLRNAWHFVEKKMEILQHVLKITVSVLTFKICFLGSSPACVLYTWCPE